jgi:RNA polymerase sigma factor (TIGR02999 family)
MPDDWDQLTLLLNRLEGSSETRNRVFDLVYANLRTIAQRLLSREAAVARRPTELLHETYLKKLHGLRVPIRNRQHFFSLATRAMRQVLIEDARRRNAEKRQTPAEADWLARGGAGRNPASLLQLDPVMEKLREIDPRAATVVDLRFLLDCTLEETADVLGITVRAVRCDWEFARRWLQRELGLASS